MEVAANVGRFSLTFWSNSSCALSRPVNSKTENPTLESAIARSIRLFSDVPQSTFFASKTCQSLMLCLSATKKKHPHQEHRRNYASLAACRHDDRDLPYWMHLAYAGYARALNSPKALPCLVSSWPTLSFRHFAPSSPCSSPLHVGNRT